MNSKKALENIKHAPGFMGGNSRYKSVLESRIPFLEDIEIIKQDLDRLEKLKKANKKLLVNKNFAQGVALKLKQENDILKDTILSIELDTRIPELKQENDKLKSVIDILVEELDIQLVTSIFADELGDYYFEFKTDTNKRTLRKIPKEKYELLKEVLINE